MQRRVMTTTCVGGEAAGIRVARPASFAVTDYLFWLMMLLANVPLILEIWGVDTVFKPYRTVSLILATMCIPAIVNERAITRKFSRPLLLAVCYVLVMSVVFGGTHVLSQLPFLCACLAMYFASYGVTSRKSLYFGLIAFIISFLISSYFGMIAFNSGRYRFSGLFENPNAFGYGGAFVFLILVNRFVPIPRTLRFVLALLVIPILILTGSRGTMLSVAGVLISQTWRNPRLFYGLIVAGICVAVLVDTVGDQVAEQFGNRAVFSRFDRNVIERGTDDRLSQVRAGLQVSAEHGFVGIGLGQYREKHHTRFFQRRGLDGQISKLELHNVFISLLCEWGLFGFLAFATIVKRMLAATKHFEYERDWVYGFLGGSFLNGLGNNLLGEIPFWIMLGVSVQMIRFAYLEKHSRPLPLSPQRWNLVDR
jgi:hypothetical protein